jgi:hypothetical protein
MKELNEIGEKGLELIRDEWDKQGHDLSGEFKRSLYYEMEVGETIKYKFLDGTDRNYGAILNRGVTAEAINAKGAWNKERMAGLMNYVEQRMGITEFKVKKRIAGAIAYKHSKEGMPTKASQRFSSTGNRIQYAQDGMKEIEPILQELFFKIVENGFK